MTSNPFSLRRARLRAELERLNLAGAFISDPNHFFYLTGFLPNKDFVSYLALDRAGAVVAVVPFYGVDVSKQAPGAEQVDVIKYANLAMVDLDRYIDEFAERDAAVREAAGRLGLLGKPLGVDAGYFSRRLAELLNVRQEQTVDVGQFLMAQRVIKDEWEQEQIAYTVRLNDVGFAATQAFLRPGVTDLQAFSVAWHAMAKALGGVFDLHGEFSGGPAISGQGGASPFGQTLQQGDILIADIYPVVHGYQADTTRNFVIGKPAPWQSELHEILEDAQAQGEAAIRPGLPAAELDRIVRGHLLKHAPAGAHTFHHMGHGVGIGVGKGAHCPPFIVPKSRDVLAEGMVLTLEPGLYLAGKGGMRLEDNYVVTKNGCRPLGTFPKKLAICAP
jgi:Xaa-Pro dipeptidase